MFRTSYSLASLSPLGWEHVNLTGDYIWSAERPVTESRDGFRPLRAGPDTARPVISQSNSIRTAASCCFTGSDAF
jgi:hypothetical protein